MRSIIAFIKLARPAQWVKNIFVFAALIFSGLVLDLNAVLHALLAFAMFSMVSSAVYFLNDFVDIEEDKLHETKKTRPLASGELPKHVGSIGFVFLAATSLGVTYITLGLITALIVLAYLIINLCYSLGMKHLVIIDVLLISAGFVLRILAGASAISRMPSTWLILCAVTISLFLGFTKRKAEIVYMGDDATKHRKVLGQYNQSFLDQAIAIVTAATVICYILYTVDPMTVKIVGSRLLIFSVPFVLYGIFRYLYLVYHDKSGGDPTKTVFTDIPLLFTGGAWAILCTVVILFGQTITQFFRAG
ncbi:MAG: decaprenyl-phosphate phosphoribosyltransferase [Deltaproteobacteria bacterium]|nr:decaprenyl-phosphate phosphoribosyltransferase [Deltaproteobacteria bacterium]MBN2670896.1 decaprenyl-phosphate phosphoribosyltransferase [Deltaproteobacteria bacterium]